MPTLTCRRGSYEIDGINSIGWAGRRAFQVTGADFGIIRRDQIAPNAVCMKSANANAAPNKHVNRFNLADCGQCVLEPPFPTACYVRSTTPN